MTPRYFFNAILFVFHTYIIMNLYMVPISLKSITDLTIFDKIHVSVHSIIGF